jgi:hypothetical protein
MLELAEGLTVTELASRTRCALVVIKLRCRALRMIQN